MNLRSLLSFMTFIGRGFSVVMHNAAPASWVLPWGLDINGLWSFKVRIKGCKNIQFGLFGPTQITSNGYFVDLNKAVESRYFSAVRKICSGCSGSPEVEVDQGGSYFNCDATYHDYWVSWDLCTIRMGKGTAIKQNEVISWKDVNITEIKYATFGASDSSTVASYEFDPTTPDPSVNTIQNCANACDAKTRPPMTTNFPPFVFHLTGDGKTFSDNDDVIANATGLSQRECNNKCLCNAQCIQFSVSAAGTCKLSNMCSPALESDANSKVYSLVKWGGNE